MYLLVMKRGGGSTHSLPHQRHQSRAIPGLHLLHLPSYEGEVSSVNAQPYPGMLVKQPSADKASVVGSITKFDEESIRALLKLYKGETSVKCQ